MRLWPRRRHICRARSAMPMGFWCTRTDKHTEHVGGGECWFGDHPYDPVEAWTPFMETFTRLLWGARVASGATTPEDAERHIARAIAGFPRLVR